MLRDRQMFYAYLKLNFNEGEKQSLYLILCLYCVFVSEYTYLYILYFKSIQHICSYIVQVEQKLGIQPVVNSGSNPDVCQLLCNYYRVSNLTPLYSFLDIVNYLMAINITLTQSLILNSFNLPKASNFSLIFVSLDNQIFTTSCCTN